MFDAQEDVNLKKAQAFFQRGEEVAATDNFDYAIDMYIEGLRKFPDALEDGHIPLRRLALIRQGKGGKKPSIKDKMTHRGGKAPVDEMLNAEFMLAKDPDNLTYAEAMLKACVTGNYHRTGEWIADLVFEANRNADKPSVATFVLLKDSYRDMELFSKAVNACRYALEQKPDDDKLREDLKNLSAHMTMQRGKYGKSGDFTESIKDRKLQENLLAKDSTVKPKSYLETRVQEARKALAKNPESEVYILALAKALVALETDAGIKEAIELLEKHYKRTHDFTYQKAAGEYQIKRLKAAIRNIRQKLEKQPENEKLKNEHTRLINLFARAELEHFQRCVEQYPGDPRMKYELGLRLMINRKYDEAIGILQQAQQDPRHKISAMDKTGMCFFFKGWYTDAADIFSQALDLCQTKDSPLAKEIRYNLARSYEEQGKNEEALEIYRKLVQLDYNYKDANRRVSALRQAAEN